MDLFIGSLNNPMAATQVVAASCFSLSFPSSNALSTFSVSCAPPYYCQPLLKAYEIEK
jgi:hypothetical protein